VVDRSTLQLERGGQSSISVGCLGDLLDVGVAALARACLTAWRDTSGLMAPYVAVMLPALIGFSTLAVDASRYMSLQTQMQAAADSLALAGARELNKQVGAQSRAISAMANAYGATHSANTIVGMGSSPTLTYAYTFFSALPAASAGIGGTAATGDGDSKYVSVTVAAQTVPTIFPLSFLNTAAVNNFSAGASAVAGNAGIAACGVAPIFICNPYEDPSGSMTDAQATAALYTAFATPSILQRQFKLNRTNTSPGHFGWLQTEDGCNNSSCMRTHIASETGACYNTTGVTLATGNHNSVEQFFDTMFDIYSQNPSPGVSGNAPSINVRKGYLPGTHANAADWCRSGPADANPTNTALTYPSDLTSGKVTHNSNSVSSVANTAGVVSGEPIVDSKGYLGSTSASPTTVTGVSGSTVTVSNNASNTNGADGLTIEWTATGLPEDTSFPNLGGIEGNGQWDCANYWGINHTSGPAPAAVGAALGGTCGTPAQTTVSRYQIYRYEISLGSSSGGINDWSGRNGWSSNGQTDAQGVHNPAGAYQTENGAPYCAAASGVSGVDTTTGGLDRRNIIVPIINCLAQTALGNITGGNTDPNVPVAGFAKFFLTQPYSEFSDGNLYGEMTGTVNSLDNVQIFNLVQLYR
jgi:Flp pilus assembly protein TadG